MKPIASLMHAIHIRPILIYSIIAATVLGISHTLAETPRVIFDTDMSSDWDDVGDIAVLHGLANLGEVNIIGCMASSTNGGTALCIDAINTYYGRPDIPVGRRPDVQGIGAYPGQIAAEFPHGPETTPTDFPLAADLYRQLLAASPNKSVYIVTAGYLNNLEALLKSSPDQHSPLNGADLVKQKLSCGCLLVEAIPMEVNSTSRWNLRRHSMW